MSEYVYIGKIINTFGIKGEVKILSDFLEKESVFKEGNEVFIGDNKLKEVINTYRVHKGYDLITFKGYNNINEILKYKGLSIYSKREVLNNKYVLNDLIDFKVIENDITYGKVIDYYDFNGNKVLYIKGSKNFYIPINDYYIKSIDYKLGIIYVLNVRDLVL